MPLITAVLAPLIALYIKFRIAGLVIRLVVFDFLYIAITNATNELANTIFNIMGSLNLPCSISWVLADLNLIGALSIYINIILSAMSLKLIFSLAVRAVK